MPKEANPNVTRSNPTLSTEKKINLSSEVFTKLLLSGVEGVCTSEATENRMYPLLASLFEGDAAANGILATRLFKPGDRPDQHRPVHKIVAEYCAADYLTQRITDPTNPLTLSKCLAIIAPNSTVRDELRGLLGWMAALGNKSIQEWAIAIDPYAVLANGDPSQLAPSSKRLLISQLKVVEAKDPYFRRGDFRRRFSMAGFFTPDVVEAIKPLLTAGTDGQLRDLILELLCGSPAIEQLRDELYQIALTSTEDRITRRLANQCLLDIDNYDHQSDLDSLIAEASSASLHLAAEIITTLGSEKFKHTYLAEFLRVCSQLYPNRRKRREQVSNDRYFVAVFINNLDFSTIECLLDELSKDLICTCGENPYKCYCRNGISEILGSMLDCYFELATPPFDPIQVWKWIGNLNFYDYQNTSQRKAVQVLQQDESLRKGIIAHVFGNLTDCDKITEIYRNNFYFCSPSHSGLRFQRDDYRFIIDLAFKTNNPKLWASFIAGHRYYQNEGERGPNDLRRHMRKQARDKPLFMREWAKTNRVAAQQFEREKREHYSKYTREIKRHRRKEEEIHAANTKYVQDNRELVEDGHHWACLVRFANLVLMNPDEIEREFGDEILVRNALRNCLDFITPHVPDLLKLAELQCESKYHHSQMILYAACLEIMRVKGDLEGVDLHLLRALRANIHMGYGAVTHEERDALRQEVDHLIFPDSDSVENFLRQYVEPQLAQSGCAHPEVSLLNSGDAFHHLRAPLSIEWLKKFNALALRPLDTLFDIAIQYGSRDDLKAIISERCAELMSNWPDQTGNEDIEQKRTFWLVRAWYFLDDPPKAYWDWLKADKNTIFLLYERSRSHWPKLTSSKVEVILDAFIDKCPKVALPNSYGTNSTPEEKAYRFLTEVIWSINSDDPDNAIPVLKRLLADSRFADLHNDLKSIYADQVRKKALRDFEPPTPQAIVNLLDSDEVVTVEGLRKLVIEELQDFQKDIKGGEFNSADRFYEKGERLGEVRSTEIIAERLSLRLEPKDISVTPEHQLKNAKRSDFTATKMINGKRRLLVTEAKGQWNTELYTAATAQLHDRYSIHPDAEQQGIFLAIWFGADEKVAGRKTHNIGSAQELKTSIEATLPQELKGLIDVFVLDVSRPSD